MNKKRFILLMIVFVLSLVSGFMFLQYQVNVNEVEKLEQERIAQEARDKAEEEARDKAEEEARIKAEEEEKKKKEESGTKSSNPISSTCPNKIINGLILVNKVYCLTPSYGGENATAKNKLNELIGSAKNEGVKFKIISGYRSYNYQKEVYQGWVNSLGQKEADKVSARPGHSEHQTGLAYDLGNGGSCDLESCFGDTKEGKWLKLNAHKYGFIIRYPKDKVNITGYSYEPWHLRYVGIEHAKSIYEQKISLEEYLGV